VSLRALTPREASIFACLADTIVAPEPVLPPIRQTDAVAGFDRWLARAPRVNRLALRAFLYAVELCPPALGFGARLRGLAPEERARLLGRVERAGSHRVRQLVKAMKAMVFLSYYGDDRVMLILGYDAEANVRRGRALRTREGRP
jgi:hypothetical protein